MTTVILFTSHMPHVKDVLAIIMSIALARIYESITQTTKL